jgi:hypothetical protein
LTVTDCRNEILQILAHQDCFTAADFADVVLDPAINDKRDALIRSVLKDLVEAGMLRALPDDTWMLTAPLGVAGQEVQISLNTAIAMASEINAFIDGTDRKDWPRADALNLGEHNILMCLAIIGELRGSDEDDDGEWRERDGAN